MTHSAHTSTRDMTRAQFQIALKRNGFKSVMGMWIDIGNGRSIGMVVNAKTFKPYYRESLSKAIKARNEDEHAALAKAEGK